MYAVGFQCEVFQMRRILTWYFAGVKILKTDKPETWVLMKILMLIRNWRQLDSNTVNKSKSLQVLHVHVMCMYCLHGHAAVVKDTHPHTRTQTCITTQPSVEPVQLLPVVCELRSAERDEQWSPTGGGSSHATGTGPEQETWSVAPYTPFHHNFVSLQHCF